MLSETVNFECGKKSANTICTICNIRISISDLLNDLKDYGKISCQNFNNFLIK